MPIMIPVPRSARGFTLIEVLIAVVILSVGLLGLAGLQATSLRNNHSAYLRSQATTLAYDIIDRMRTNKTVAQGVPGGYALALTASPPAPPTPPACLGAPCDSAQLATFDLNNWIQSIITVLPLGAGGVVTVGNVVTVTVAWDDNRNGLNTDPDETFVMSTQL